MKRERRSGPLVIGYGNPTRGDDGVGPYVAAELGGVVAHQLVPEMAEGIAGEDFVVFVDARADAAPGSVEVAPLDEQSASSHSCSPGQLLRLARVVYGRAPRAVLIGIGAESFDLGAPLSAAALKGAREAAARIRGLNRS